MTEKEIDLKEKYEHALQKLNDLNIDIDACLKLAKHVGIEVKDTSPWYQQLFCREKTARENIEAKYVDFIDELKLMLKVFLGVIETYSVTGLVPQPGSPCHKKIEELLAKNIP